MSDRVLSSISESADLRETIRGLNRLIRGLKYSLPQLNPNLGQAEPKAEDKYAGLIAYADGTNWNPGSGEGEYMLNAAGNWVKL